MTPSGPARPPELPASQRVLDEYIRRLLGRIRPQRVLLMCLESGVFPCLSENGGMLLATLCPPGATEGATLVCDLAELPFGEGEFELVILHHLVSDGAERELREACRVLKPGGHIIVTGRGPLALRRPARPAGAGLKTGRLARALGRDGYRVADRFGVGLFRADATLDRRWQRPLLVLCEQVLVRARHRERESLVRPMRFSRPGTARARGAALDGLSRQATP